MDSTVEKALKDLHRHAQFRAKYAKPEEIGLLNGIIKTLVTFYNATDKEQYLLHKDILAIKEKVDKLEIIAQLFGVTPEGINELLGYPKWFLRFELERRKKENSPVKHNFDLHHIEMTFTTNYDDILNDATTAGCYSNVYESLASQEDKETREVLAGFLKDLESENRHLAPIFHQIKYAHRKYTDNELIKEIEEIYAGT